MTDEHDDGGPMPVPVPVKTADGYECPQCGTKLTLHGEPPGSDGAQCLKCVLCWSAGVMAKLEGPQEEVLTACGKCEWLGPGCYHCHSPEALAGLIFEPYEGRWTPWPTGLRSVLSIAKVNIDGHCPHFGPKATETRT